MLFMNYREIVWCIIFSPWLPKVFSSETEHLPSFLLGFGPSFFTDLGVMLLFSPRAFTFPFLWLRRRLASTDLFVLKWRVFLSTFFSFLNMIHRDVSSFSNWLSSVSILRASQPLVLSGTKEAVMFVTGKVTSVTDSFSSSPKIQLRQTQDTWSVMSKCICARSQSFQLFSAPVGQSQSTCQGLSQENAHIRVQWTWSRTS